MPEIIAAGAPRVADSLAARGWTVGAALLSALLVAAAPRADAGAAELLARVQSAALDPARAVWVRGLGIEVGQAVLEVRQGVLFPAEPVDGHTFEIVFIGQARLLLEAPDEIEAGQLELFTGERSLDAPVEEAVLVLTNQDAVGDLLRRPSSAEALRPDLVERARQIHARWRNGTELRVGGIPLALVKYLVGDAAYRHYFALWCRSFALGDFFYHYDPEDAEQTTLASFRPLELSNWERARMRHEIRVQQRKGRWLDVRVDDLGVWDVWFSTPWSPGAPGSDAGHLGFEVEHYDLDVTIRRRKSWLEGRARLHLRVGAPDRRTVRLALMRDLQITAVRDASGRELEHLRAGEEAAVLLPEPAAEGERLILDVEFTGRALQWVRGRTYDLVDTDGWYPRGGAGDQATYDVTLRWPEELQLLGSGRPVSSGRAGGYRWERRRLDVPAIAFTFVLGRFHVDRTRVGHTDIAVAFDRGARRRLTPARRQRVTETAARALEFFEATFGPYPLDHLTLVSVPRPYSQSYLGFVTLAESVVTRADPWGDSEAWMREMTVAHELAHQWWGNLVGWWSYRDQWLSEGMANYAALLFDSRKDAAGTDRLTTLAAGWRESLARATVEGRPVESLGPVVLGNRLNSSRASDGYRTIVYRKGAVVLAMLARVIGEERFVPMLRSLAEAAAHRAVTTESFLEALERMSGLELDSFARQYVYGTGIPEVYYGYETARGEDGRWTMRGEASLLSIPRYRYAIVGSPEQGREVLRRPGTAPGGQPISIIVPYRLTLDGSANRGAAGERVERTGELVLHGRRDDFAIETELQPLELQLDPRGEILAWFYSAEVQPKRVLRYEAEDLAAGGRLEEAETRFQQALRTSAAAPSPVDPLDEAVTAPRIDERVENVRIRLALARLYLQQGREGEATAALDAIDRELAGDGERSFRVERDALRSRIDLRHGGHAAALRRLKKTLRALSPRRDGAPEALAGGGAAAGGEQAALAEAYALLAVAAEMAGAEEDLRWALREARGRGVDVSAFRPTGGAEEIAPR
jgi:hypothetical protein